MCREIVSEKCKIFTINGRVDILNLKVNLILVFPFVASN